MQKLLFPLLVLFPILTVPAKAQRSVMPGDTVRMSLHSGGAPVRGVITAATVDRITLRFIDGDERIFPATTIRSINLLDGRTQARGGWARAGFVLGMLGGAAIAATRGRSGLEGSGRSLGRTSIGAMVGGLVGAAAGLSLSWNFEKNHWVEVRVPEPVPSLPPGGRAAVALVAGAGAESTVLVGLRLRR